MWRFLLLLALWVRMGHASNIYTHVTLPFNQTLVNGFTTPMCRYEVIANLSNSDLLVEADLFTGQGSCERGGGGPERTHHAKVNAKRAHYSVELVGYIYPTLVPLAPIIFRPLNVDLVDQAFINESLLHPETDLPPQPILSPVARRLLALAAANMSSLDAFADCDVGALNSRKNTGLGWARHINPVAAILDWRNRAEAGQDRKNNAVRCKVNVNNERIRAQTETLDYWLGSASNPGGGAFSKLANGTKAVAEFFANGIEWFSDQDELWEAQNNFTRDHVDRWITVYNETFDRLRRHALNNIEVLTEVDRYSRDQFGRFDSSLTALSQKTQELVAENANHAAIFAQLAASTRQHQSLSIAEVARLYSVAESQLRQTDTTMLALFRGYVTFEEERRAMTLAVHQTRAAAENAGLEPFLRDLGVPPTLQALPPPHELTFEESQQPEAEGQGDNIEHLTIVYTRKCQAGSTPGTCNSAGTPIVADELYVYANDNTLLEDVAPWFTLRDLQLLQDKRADGVEGVCSSSDNCALWTTYYRHSCAGHGYRDGTTHLQYTLSDPLPPPSGSGPNIPNPVHYKLRSLLGCTSSDVHTNPDSPNAGSLGPERVRDMTPLQSRATFADYLEQLCSDPNIVGPVFVYSWLQSLGALVPRDPNRCATSYRRLTSQQGRSSTALTLPGAVYDTLTHAIAIEMASNPLRESRKYGVLPQDLTVTHLPMVADGTGRISEAWITAFVSPISDEGMVPMYVLRAIGWSTDVEVTDGDDQSSVTTSLREREDFDLPLGATHIHIGWLECLFRESCGPDGRVLYDVPSFLVSGLTPGFAPGRAHLVDYIRAPPTLQPSSSNRHTWDIPPPRFTLNDWLLQENSPFDASAATVYAASYRRQLVQMFPNDTSRAHRIRSVGTGDGDMMSQTLEHFGVECNRPDDPEQSTRLSFIPEQSQIAFDFLARDGPTASPPLRAGCPFVGHITTSVPRAAKPTISIRNAHPVSVSLDVEFGLAPNCPVSTLTNVVLAHDETRVLEIPVCGPAQRVRLWKTGVSHSIPTAKCFERVLDARPNQPLPTFVPATPPPFVNASIQFVRGTVDRGLWQAGRLALMAAHDLTTSVVDAARAIRARSAQDPLTPELIGNLTTNVTARSLWFEAQLLNVSAQTASDFDRTRIYIDSAHAQAGALKATADALAASTSSVLQAGIIVSQRSQRNETLIALQNQAALELKIKADNFNSMVEAAAALKITFPERDFSAPGFSINWPSVNDFAGVVVAVIHTGTGTLLVFAEFVTDTACELSFLSGVCSWPGIAIAIVEFLILWVPMIALYALLLWAFWKCTR